MSKENQAKVMLVGRILMGLLFVVAAWSKSGRFDGSVAYMAKNGVPMAELMLYAALILEFVGGALLILGWKTRWTAIILAIFVAVITPIFHGFWAFEPAQMTDQLNHFLKNISIVGGLLYIFAFGAGSKSIDGDKA